MQKSENGSSLKGILFLIILVGVVFLSVAYVFGRVVPPGKMGVRQITFGPYQGFSEQGLAPGYHWNIPFYSRVHLLPETVQVFNLHRNIEKYPKSPGALEVQTTDGAIVDVDISILSRFHRSPTEDHTGPAELFTQIGTSPESWENHIRRTADDELRRALGKLETGEFYDPVKREEQVRKAHTAMIERLAPYGIAIESVLIRRYTYRAERIDTAIFEKNIQDQEERLNTVSSKLAEAQAQLEGVAAEWDAKIKTLRVDGDNKARVLRSEGDLYESEKVAEGDLLVATAQAEVDELRANALNQSLGSDLYVARELAPLLSSLKGGVVSNLDPYDLELWMKRLGIPKEGQ